MSVHREHRQYLNRIQTQASSVFDLSQIPKWIEQNTSSPKDPDLPWNFKEHEYQVEILADMSDEVVAQKCSQVGASELWVRLMLGMLGLAKSMTIIYVLPTRGFAQKFAKQRIDPVIAQSPVLSSMINNDVNSSELKQLGNNFLYIAGSYGQNAAISVPARGLFQDEVDFCNQTTLTTFNSRLGHNKPGEYYKRSFSTPTVEKFGINLMYSKSSMAKYTVKCNGCEDWVAPNYMENVEIPGFDGNLITFEKEDLENPYIEVENAFIRCPSCNTPIDWQRILNPQMRQWIHEKPDVSIRGYQILPIDVPAVNPIARTIRQITEYDRKKDWVNFKVGYTYSDAETSFIQAIIDQYSTFPAIRRPDEGEDDLVLAKNTVFGLDIGKISWFVVMAKVEGVDRVIYYERIKQDGANYLGLRICLLIKVFGCVKGVVDAGPDISVSKFLVDSQPENRVWACYYVRQQKGVLENYKLNEAEQIVTASRTGCFDYMAKRVNSGKTQFAKAPELATVKTHLSNVKRVDTTNDQGEMISSWVKTGEDHYAHAANYAHIAMSMLDSGSGSVKTTPHIPSFSRAKMLSEPEPMVGQGDDPLRLNFAPRERQKSAK